MEKDLYRLPGSRHYGSLPETHLAADGPKQTWPVSNIKVDKIVLIPATTHTHMHTIITANKDESYKFKVVREIRRFGAR